MATAPLSWLDVRMEEPGRDAPWIAPAGSIAPTYLATRLACQQIYVLAHAGPPETPFALNPLKGAFGERLMHTAFSEGLLERTKWSQVDPGHLGSTGIDGLYLRVNGFGQPTRMMVAEAKFGTSQLGVTQDGRQMSPRWIERRLSQASRRYLEVSRELRNSPVIRISGGYVPPDGATPIPLGRNKTAYAWRGRHGWSVSSADPSVGPVEACTGAEKIGTFLKRASLGQVRYRSHLFQVQVEGDKFVVSSRSLSPGGVSGVITTRNQRFADLPAPFRRGIRRALVQSYRADGASLAEARQCADQACRNPRTFLQQSRRPRWRWQAGLNDGALRAGTQAAVVGVLVDAALQLFITRRVDARRLAASGAIAGTTAVVSYYVGVQTTLMTSTTTVGHNLLRAIPGGMAGAGPIASAVSAGSGAAFASVIIAYGGVLVGAWGIRAAHRQAAAGVAASAAGLGFTSGTLSLAMTVGTASTGTAISTLSGAVASNAALAWLGGGALSAGGFGVAGGIAVLTAGTAVVVVGIGVALTKVWAHLDEVDVRRMILGRLTLTLERVEAGNQPEWSAV